MLSKTRVNLPQNKKSRQSPIDSQCCLALNSFIFIAGITNSQMRLSTSSRNQTIYQPHTWDSCVSLVVYGSNPGEAQKCFEAWAHPLPEGEHPIQTEIKKIVAGQFVEHLFNESGHEPIDWPRVSAQASATLQADAPDDFEPGYWADVNLLVRPENLAPDIELLQQSLPEDIRSGLNWSADKTYFFLVIILSPPPPPTEMLDEPEPEEPQDEDSPDAGDASVGGASTEFPQLADMKAAALVQARNSVVAAWLWRKFAAGTSLATDNIRIDPWCGAIAAEDTPLSE